MKLDSVQIEYIRLLLWVGSSATKLLNLQCSDQEFILVNSSSYDIAEFLWYKLWK